MNKILVKLTHLMHQGERELKGFEVWALRTMILATIGLICFLAAEQFRLQFPDPVWKLSEVSTRPIKWTERKDRLFGATSFVIPEETIKKLKNLKETPAFYLGTYYGNYRVWINDIELETRSSEGLGGQIWFSLPSYLFKEEVDDQIEGTHKQALRVRAEIALTRPFDKREALFNSRIKPGIYQATDSIQIQRGWIFRMQASHYLLLAIYFVFGFVFFAVWRISSERWDYCFFSAYALLEGLIHIAFSANFHWQTQGLSLLAPLMFCEAIFTLRIGFSFARVNRALSHWLYPILFLGLVVIGQGVSSEKQNLFVINLLQYLILPSCLFLSGFLCWLQLWHIQKERIQGVRRRKWRLLSVGGLFAFLAIANILENTFFGVSFNFASWSRPLNLALLFYASHIFISELRVEKTRDLWQGQLLPREKPRAA